MKRNKINIGIIGIGYLGKFHLEKFLAHKTCNIEWIVDLNPKNIKNVVFISEKKPLGTAGSLKKILKKNFKNLILINGDLFFQTKFKKLISFHNNNSYEATV